jgi:hypothetical protein
MTKYNGAKAQVHTHHPEQVKHRDSGDDARQDEWQNNEPLEDRFANEFRAIDRESCRRAYDEGESSRYYPDVK